MNKMKEEGNGRYLRSISLEEVELRERDLAAKKLQLELKEKELSLQEREMALQDRRNTQSLHSNSSTSNIPHPSRSPLSPNHTPTTSFGNENENPSCKVSNTPSITYSLIPKCPRSIPPSYKCLDSPGVASVIVGDGISHGVPTRIISNDVSPNIIPDVAANGVSMIDSPALLSNRNNFVRLLKKNSSHSKPCFIDATQWDELKNVAQHGYQNGRSFGVFKYWLRLVKWTCVAKAMTLLSTVGSRDQVIHGCCSDDNGSPRMYIRMGCVPIQGQWLTVNKYTWLMTHNAFAITKEPSHTGTARYTFDNQEDTVTDQLNEVQKFLSANLTEIITIIVEDYVHASKGLTRVFTDAGLMKYMFPISKMPKNGKDWPTIIDMVSHNQRLLVFNSNSSKEAIEGIAYQWNYTVENKYGYDGTIPGSCSNLGMVQVQHLIEKSLMFDMDRDDCVEVLAKHAKIKPIVTLTENSTCPYTLEWVGMIFGTAVQTIVLIFITWRTDWDREDDEFNVRQACKVSPLTHSGQDFDCISYLHHSLLVTY
eukprot:Gb_16588 [translate_table: standard]